MLDRFNAFLDRYVLPWPVWFLTHRFVILATIALLVPLIIFAQNTVVVLSINSYLNVMSVAVSSIVLLYAMAAEVRQKKIAELQEQRAQEDHEHVTEMHQLVLEELAEHHEEIEDLRVMLAMIQGEQYERKAARPKPNLRELHPRGHERFAAANGKKRLAHQGLDINSHRNSIHNIT